LSPDTAITYDRFHVTKLIIEAVQETRREEQRQGGWQRSLLKGSHWALVRNPENQTDQQAKVAKVIAMPLLNLKTGRAY